MPIVKECLFIILLSTYKQVFVIALLLYNSYAAVSLCVSSNVCVLTTMVSTIMHRVISVYLRPKSMNLVATIIIFLQHKSYVCHCFWCQVFPTNSLQPHLKSRTSV